MFQDVKRKKKKKKIEANLVQVLKHLLWHTHYDIFLELGWLILLNTWEVFAIKHCAFSEHHVKTILIWVRDDLKMSALKGLFQECLRALGSATKKFVMHWNNRMTKARKDLNSRVFVQHSWCKVQWMWIWRGSQITQLNWRRSSGGRNQSEKTNLRISQMYSASHHLYQQSLPHWGFRKALIIAVFAASLPKYWLWVWGRVVGGMKSKMR